MTKYLIVLLLGSCATEAGDYSPPAICAPDAHTCQGGNRVQCTHTGTDFVLLEKCSSGKCATDCSKYSPVPDLTACCVP